MKSKQLLKVFISFAIKELKRMQALLRSNLPAIDSLRYAVTLLRDGTLVLSLCVTDIAAWLRKPAVSLAGTYYMDNLLSVNRDVSGHMFLFSPIK